MQSEPVLPESSRGGLGNPSLGARIVPLGIYHTDDLTQGHKDFRTRLHTAVCIAISRRRGKKQVGNRRWFDKANYDVFKQRNVLCSYKE